MKNIFFFILILNVCTCSKLFSQQIINGNREPKFDSGQLQENASILCTATQGDFTDSHTMWIPLNTDYNGGPNMGWKGQTGCFATTEAKFNGSGSATTYRAEIDVVNKCGGICGVNGTNKGGEGQLAPIYKTNLQLPLPIDSSKWFIDISIKGEYTTGKISSQYKIKITNPDSSVVKSCNMDNTEHIFRFPNTSPGIYDIEIDFPTLSRACYGAPNGTRSESDFTTTIVFYIYQK